MVEVIDKQKNYSVSVFFILLMMIGNFMLLNLFLAILLKSISEIGNKEGDDVGDKAANDEEGDNGSAKDGADGNE